MIDCIKAHCYTYTYIYRPGLHKYQLQSLYQFQFRDRGLNTQSFKVLNAAIGLLWCWAWYMHDDVKNIEKLEI